MLDFIERLRAKPEHIRARIALGTASAVTGMVTLGWFGALLAGNAFDLSTPTGASLVELNGGQETSLPNALANAKSGFSAVLEASETGESPLVDDGVIIVDVSPKEVLPAEKPDERTIIPF